MIVSKYILFCISIVRKVGAASEKTLNVPLVMMSQLIKMPSSLIGPYFQSETDITCESSKCVLTTSAVNGP